MALDRRYPMRLAYSEDNGKTWRFGHDIEVERGHVKDGHEFSYPVRGLRD